MYLCLCPREVLLSFLPRGGVVAEIGTAQGEFAQAILDNAAPQRLHLIDPWEHQRDNDYVRDLNNVETAEQNARFRGVLRRFADPIARKRVVVHRRYSIDAADGFEDGSFDFVYVDGNHSFDGVRADLAAYAPKIKPDGFLVGHDYTNNPSARSQGIGTIEAVNAFVAETDFDLLLMTLEAFPTYVLALPGAHVTRLVAMLLYARAIAAEIQGYPAVGGFEHRQYTVGDLTDTLAVFRMPGGPAA